MIRTDKWQIMNHPINTYPIGTKARESWSGGWWTKTKYGWKWLTGDTFARPGAADQIKLPKRRKNDSQKRF